jgi:hypothetical protein
LVVYLLFGMFNNKTARNRNDRKFMEGYERKDRKSQREREDKSDRGTSYAVGSCLAPPHFAPYHIRTSK